MMYTVRSNWMKHMKTNKKGRAELTVAPQIHACRCVVVRRLCMCWLLNIQPAAELQGGMKVCVARESF